MELGITDTANRTDTIAMHCILLAVYVMCALPRMEENYEYLRMIFSKWNELNYMLHTFSSISYM